MKIKNKALNKNRRKTAIGAATLVLSVILMTLSTLIILFAAEYGKLEGKSISNLHRSQQAFEAATAGLDYGINYFNTNNAAILASPSGGYIQPYTSTNTTNVTLSNGSKYSITYTNPVANNYELILVASAGTSDDGTATRTINQLIQFGSLALNPPNAAISSLGSVSMSGNSKALNPSSTTTIQSASTVTLGGTSSTLNSGGTASTPGNIQSDITQNSPALSSQTSTDFFASNFGITTTLMKSKAEYYYSNSTSTSYSTTLNGKSGTSIWIDQTGGTASIGGGTTIGTSTNPVLLIINGDASIGGSVTFYGYLFVLGTLSTDSTGNVNIFGGLSTTSSLNIAGVTTITYSQTVMDNLQNNSKMRYYAKIPGSWKDF